MWQALRGAPAGLVGWLSSRLPPCLVPLLAAQCRYVSGFRLRRAQQLYTERSARALIRGLRGRARPGRTGRLLAALTGAFLWEEERVREEEIRRSAEDMQHMEVVAHTFQGLDSPVQIPVSDGEQSWELVIDKKDFKLWKRPIEGTHLYQYRVFGSYMDVTPRQFFNVQLDTEYRKKWDALVIKLEVVERDGVPGSEVIHWVTHFPYPMYSRDYVYIRKYHVDQENNLMVLVSRAVEHPGVPESPDYVRVRNYQSQMVIRPHTSFDEGCRIFWISYIWRR
ncbi:hypothetical protein FKM82_028524 [Ascaphus truei]